jgi:outer membrane lipopolysaccharide assembly protein LptE/RlpB
MIANLKGSVAVLLVLSLSACGGWSLRGTRTDAIGVDSVYVSAPEAQRLRRALITELVNAGVRVNRKRSEAGAVIELDSESFDRRVLSVDSDTGKVREIELGLEVVFSIRGRDGKLLVAPEKLSWVQDFVFDENSLLGTNERANIVERELAEDAAQTIRLRLETIDFSAQNPPK